MEQVLAGLPLSGRLICHDDIWYPSELSKRRYTTSSRPPAVGWSEVLPISEGGEASGTYCQ